MEGFFGFLWIAMLACSVWGAFVLAMKWAKSVWARILLVFVLSLIFWAAGTTAIISGCVAVVGPPNFH